MSAAATTTPAADAPVLRRLRPAVHVAPVADGLLFVGWQQSLVLHGSESLSRLWDALFPHLHRGVDFERLLGALPETARTAARTMLDELDHHGFLLREQPLQLVHPMDDSRAAHPEHRRTRAFLDAAADDPAGAERSLRTTPVAVHGRGDVALSAARSLIRLGVGDVVVTDAELRERLQDLADEHGAVLLADDHSHLAVTVTVGPVEPTGYGPRIGVVELGDHAVVGPLRAAPTDPGVEQALLRMRARGDHAEPAPVPTVAARLAGGLAALQVVHHVCGIRTEYDGRAHVVDAERLTTTTHPVVLAGRDGAAPLLGRAGSAPELAALDELSDERTGLFAPLTPADLPQTPLALVGTTGPAGDTVHGWARSGDVARYRAALETARRSAGPAPRLWVLDGAPPARWTQGRFPPGSPWQPPGETWTTCCRTACCGSSPPPWPAPSSTLTAG